MARILIVEDEIDLAESIRDWLTLEGHRVEFLTNGAEASSRLKSSEFDIIILDLILPDKDGIQICREYRQAKGEARILVITARDSIRDREYGLDSGADDYIVKPLDLREVSARVRALMRRSVEIAHEKLQVADLEIDISNRTVKRAGTKIELLPQEYALLEYLARHPNRIFSAEKLIQCVWNGQSSPNTVRTHIKTLRRKIEAIGKEPLIKTVHGLGYGLSDLNSGEKL